MRAPTRSILPVVCLAAAVFTVGRAGALDVARLSFAEIYKSVGVLGLKFSDKVQELAGRPVTMKGYMAPPLKPEADFFVMTKEPVSLCPFCQSDADWPMDIVVVHLQRGSNLMRNTDPIEVTGTLEVGSATDPKTGFVSLLRIVDARLRRL
jgi:hypothetical protein